MLYLFNVPRDPALPCRRFAGGEFVCVEEPCPEAIEFEEERASERYGAFLTHLRSIEVSWYRPMRYPAPCTRTGRAGSRGTGWACVVLRWAWFGQPVASGGRWGATLKDGSSATAFVGVLQSVASKSSRVIVASRSHPQASVAPPQRLRVAPVGFLWRRWVGRWLCPCTGTQRP